ncbi:hypothetical protein DFH29DRAFT_1005225 [Suillus ampliporus]|nr:hypothetical protein DFH29DRAFT_1005225 [Suillus ampliporus]
MQFALFASLAILCNTALAAPSERRGGDDISGIDVGVTDVWNNLDITILSNDKRGDDLIGVVADVKDILDDANVDILSQRDC